MDYHLILFIVISSLLTMSMCFTDKRAELENEPNKRIKSIYILISSILLGSPGVLMAILSFGYKQNDRKFVIANLVIIILQGLLIFYL